MTQEQAFEISKKEGKKIAHRYFSKGEWIKIVDNYLETEEGYMFPVGMFMEYRQGNEWQKDWHIAEETIK